MVTVTIPEEYPLAHTISIILTALSLATQTTLAQDSWELFWSDEFDTGSLDLNNWSYQTGTGTAYGLPAGWGNNELQYYTNTTQNVSVSNGLLTITAREQAFGGRDYTSARIRTLNKVDFRYGRIEARMKIPSTQGIWPAFWMLPTNSPYGGWASSGEIDIMESVNVADRIYGTLHYGNPFPGNHSGGPRFSDGTDFSQEFHVYRVDWDPETITWFIDDIPYGTLNKDQWFSSADPANPLAPFDTEFHMLLNVAVGGNFPGNPNAQSVFPQKLEVDYVRVYERVQSPFTGTPMQLPGTIQAEDFDLGIQGQSYNDCDPTNNGGAYRSTGVDIQVASDGGFNVGWICPGEWIEYTVDVQTTGMYTLEARVASLATGGSFRIERDGVDLTGAISVPPTGGWQNWQSVIGGLNLEQGEQVLRFVNLSTDPQEFNLNSFTFDLQTPNGCNAADLAMPYGELNFFDVSAFINALNAQSTEADINGDGMYNFFDVSEFLALMSAGCP